MQQPQRRRITQLLVSICARSALLALSGSVLGAPVLTSVSSGPQTPDPVAPGSNATYVVTVTRTGNGNMDVYLSAYDLPTGATATFLPNPVHFTGPAPASATAQLVVTTTDSTLPGSYDFSLVADDGTSFNIITNTATLNVGLSGAGIVRLPDGSISVSFDTPTGQVCRLQATTNLFDAYWTTLCTTNSGTFNLLMFVDQDAPKYPSRFYRLAMP
jgi:hypothetical protein